MSFTGSFGRVAVACSVFQGLASVTMMLGNKQLARVFPFPFLVILIQNFIVFLCCGGIVLTRADERQRAFQLRPKHFWRCLWVGIATALVLTSSIVALRFSSVPLVVTFRNLTPIVVAALDHVVLGTNFQRSAQLGLVCGVVGSLLYSVFDPPRAEEVAPALNATNQKLVASENGKLTKTSAAVNNIMTSVSDVVPRAGVLFASELGLAFVVGNMFLSAIVNILESTTMRSLNEEQSPSSVNCIRIAVMTPVLLAFSLVFDDIPQAVNLLHADCARLLTSFPWSQSELAETAALLKTDDTILAHRVRALATPVPLLLLTGVFAAMFGVSTLTLSSLRISPTTLAFLNVFYKLLTTVAGHFVFPSVVPLASWLGYGLTFCGFLSYALGRIKPSGGSTEDKKDK
ncbi:unnamed protein product [Amoebophrya sp. A25]|nr:unnamed protein product [Amoebophrya sp. A25]|eukprot:GSA25T00000096001.1